MTPAEGASTAAATTAALRWGLVMQHLRQNNVSYLLLVAIAHMLGLLQPVVEYGQGICQ